MKPTFWCLDFDGVLCDSARETGAAAWKAGRTLWPEWPAAEPPPALLERFRGLRPLLETGWQAILLLRLLEQGTPPAALAADFAAHIEAACQAAGRTVPELVRLFGETRDRWLAEAPEDWLARHRFYPGVAAALTAALAYGPVAILTTKQERFTRRLLAAAGVEFPAARIFGLDRGRSKEATLAELLAGAESATAEFALVEDRLATLERIAERPELAAVRLIFAAWGYSTPAERARAAAQPRIESWPLGRFTAALAAPHSR
ncbi:MAG: HAD family hydrolase [Lentisphaeria bacterium]|jgi:phosphoglycolate phosphatase-like HAD superfamily hydrolase